jgi:type I site-specific restriction-modification system R (restriction) subunit
MVDEVKKDPNAGVEIPGESKEVSLNPREQQEIAIKERARDLGWKALKEYEGDPADWVSAKEFLSRQSFFDKIKSQSAEIRSLKTDIQLMAKHFSEMKEVEYKRALNELKSERREAISSGDTAKAETVSEQIVEIETARKDSKTPTVDADYGKAEFAEFKSKNVWYDKDQELTEHANYLGLGYAQKHPKATPQQVLDYMEKEIKKLQAPKKVVAPSSPESGGIKQGERNTPGVLKESDLNDVQRKAMGAFVARGILTKQEYLKQLSEKEGNR